MIFVSSSWQIAALAATVVIGLVYALVMPAGDTEYTCGNARRTPSTRRSVALRKRAASCRCHVCRTAWLTPHSCRPSGAFMPS
jgi:hypothetical protein